MYQTQMRTYTIIIKPKLLVINYNRNNSFFSKIIGYNRIKIK